MDIRELQRKLKEQAVERREKAARIAGEALELEKVCALLDEAAAMYGKFLAAQYEETELRCRIEAQKGELATLGQLDKQVRDRVNARAR
jgi:hypothetical protein